MIGPLITIYKGRKTNNELKQRLAEVEQQLDGLDSIEELLARIEQPYDRVIAKNQLLLANYYRQREQSMSLAEMKTRWEMVKEEMAATIQQTEQQLQEMSATKLDIARILASLTQLSNEFDLEIQALKQDNKAPKLATTLLELKKHPIFLQLETKVTIQGAELTILKHNMKDFVNQYALLKEQYEHSSKQSTTEHAHVIAQLTELKKVQQKLINSSNERHEDIEELRIDDLVLKKELRTVAASVASHEATLKTTRQQVEQLEREQQAAKEEHESVVAKLTQLEVGGALLKKDTVVLQQQASEQQHALQQLEERTTATLSDVQQTVSAKMDKLMEKLTLASAEINVLEQSIDARMLQVQQQLYTQKSEWTARADVIDEAIRSQAKAQKKRLMQWTVPLYVVVAGIVVALFLL
ncbi:MAG: hypothetical protein ABS948_05405 [Solibacillus sp.]